MTENFLTTEEAAKLQYSSIQTHTNRYTYIHIRQYSSMQETARKEIDKGAIRRIRRAIIRRSEELESLVPAGKCEDAETRAYISGLEFALRAIDINLPEL